MNDIKFKTLQDLYDRLKPALTCQVNAFHHEGFKYIDIEDLWGYLKDYKWEEAQDLDLAQMVNDIFNLKIEEIVNYRHNNF